MKITLKESELKQLIREAVEESGFLQGAHKGALDNLNRKKDMGYLYTTRPTGKRIPNDKRLKPLETHNEDMNNDFFEQYNGEPVVIPFSVYLNNGFIYAFNYTLTRIENINAKYLSIVGNMEITRTIGNPDSFMNAYSPRIKDDVVLKYDIANSILKFTRNPKGLVIRPALNVNGTNNTRWNELVQYATDYLKGLHRVQRP